MDFVTDSLVFNSFTIYLDKGINSTIIRVFVDVDQNGRRKAVSNVVFKMIYLAYDDEFKSICIILSTFLL